MPAFDINQYHREQHQRQLIDLLHKEFKLAFSPDSEAESGYVLTSEFDDWRLQPFLTLFSERCQKAIISYLERSAERKTADSKSRLSGGPFDGEPIEQSKWPRIFCRRVRRARWAVYRRKRGEYEARFVGFATSRQKGRILAILDTDTIR